MKYIPSILKSLFSIAVFAIGASSASASFEYVVVAGLGIIFVTVDFGITNIQQIQSETTLSNLRVQLATLKIISKPEDDAEMLYATRRLDIADERIDEYKIIMAIQAISSLIIVAGCLYLMLKSLNV